MNFYQNPAPTPFVTVGNTGLHQPQLQQSIKSHLSQEQYIAELENRLRALWDKYEEAVKKGHAELAVDCAGKTQFKWKEVKP